jgi:Domain of unknown function (DUF6916)
MTDLSDLHSKSFADQLHTSFNVDSGGSAPVSLRLTAVNEPSTPPNIELFSLTFTGPAAPRLPQRTYPVQHEKIGSFNLFLTAIASDASGITYEAVFHRLRKTQP